MYILKKERRKFIISGSPHSILGRKVWTPTLNYLFLSLGNFCGIVCWKSDFSCACVSFYMDAPSGPSLPDCRENCWDGRHGSDRGTAGHVHSDSHRGLAHPCRHRPTPPLLPGSHGKTPGFLSEGCCKRSSRLWELPPGIDISMAYSYQKIYFKTLLWTRTFRLEWQNFVFPGFKCLDTWLAFWLWC